MEHWRGALFAVLIQLSSCASRTTSLADPCPSDDGSFSVSDGGPNLSAFTGASWAGTGTVTAKCPGENPFPEPYSFAVTFTPVDVAYLFFEASGCEFVFAVSPQGNSASLFNGPVSCSTGAGALGGPDSQGSYPTTFDQFTLTSCDGHHLSASITGWFLSSEYGNCTFTETIDATR
jgi:hypothetical protein